MTPRCTYRLQLSSRFTFDDAAARVPYLAALGISHLYLSPILQAAPGSTHGYDVVDPTRISADLGGDPGFQRLAETAARHGLGLIVDIVPNHMATAGRANPWWWDLLSKGESSRYARYFDIDWDPSTSAMRGQVLLGALGDRYGRELDSGALKLEGRGADVVVRYHDQEFPITPESHDGLLLDEVNRNPDELDAVLRSQHYRLAYWRSAQEEINYRRFFTIDSLIGLRVEDQRVFDESHRRVLDLVQSGEVAGLRVDHVDGLRDPGAYLERLRSAAPESFIAAEKILGLGERMPPFPVEGTTGYDFIAAVDGLFVDSANEASMTALYHAFSGEASTYPEVVHAAKLEVATGELAPDFERLVARLVEICAHYRRHRDRTRRELLEAVREVAVGSTVYRTYVTPRAPASEDDRRHVEAAAAEAGRRRPDIDPDLLAFIAELLLLEHPGESETEFALRFQQVTPALMAKGVEDTAFYRYHRLVSLNEVGGDPGTFGRTPRSFHEWCAGIARDWPHTMLTLSTHDTKRSGDVRARIDLLSEIPAEWEAAVRRWSEHNDRHRARGFPDRNLEYLMYQTLAGAWPLDAPRLVEALVKSSREANVHTSWTNPVAAYEEAVAGFAGAVLSDAEFTADLESFIGRTQLVALGRLTALAQIALLLTCPGVPDLYQGSETWSLTLVDPDNRRPVEYPARESLLHDIREADVERVVARADEGATKQWMIARLLARRREWSGYSPIEAGGARAAHAIAFTREDLFVLVPRLVVKLAGDWADTVVSLPAGTWISILTGETFEGGREVAVADLTRRFPIVVLEPAAG